MKSIIAGFIRAISRTVLAVLLAASVPVTVRGEPGTLAVQHSIPVGGIERSYRLYAPAGGMPKPAVILLHGGGGQGRVLELYTGFNRLADAERIVAVYPQGAGNHWNDGRVRGAQSQADDVAFIRALVTHLSESNIVDPRRVYVAGISNGGLMALRLACEIPDLLAGAAIIAASQPVDAPCPSPTPLPIVFFNGTDDGLVPFSGGPIGFGKIERGSVIGHDRTVGAWRDRNGCTPAARVEMADIDEHDRSRAIVHRYDCPRGAGLAAVVIEGGGHTWPGSTGGGALEAILGPTNRDIDANGMMWTFFEEWSH